MLTGKECLFKFLLNTVAAYTSDGPSCIGTLSENTSHSTEAVKASFPSMAKTVKLKISALKELFIVTDSPSSQYKIITCAYLTKKLKRKHASK